MNAGGIFAENQSSKGHLRQKSIDILAYEKVDVSHILNAPDASHIPNESLADNENHNRGSSSSPAVLGKLKGTALKLKSKLKRHSNDGPSEYGSSDEAEEPDLHPATSYDLEKINSANLPHVERKAVASTSTLDSSMGNSHSHDSSLHGKHNMNGTTKQHLESVGIDLENTTDTLKHTHIAPAVTQETVKPVINEIQTEEITRDIHNTEVLYRIQPVKETVVLPARHFVESLDGVRHEVPESRVQELVDINMRQFAEELKQRERTKPLPPTPTE